MTARGGGGGGDGGGIDGDRIGDVADVLLALEDPRCAPALRSAVLDPKCGADARGAALDVLAALPADDPDHATAVGWATSHDPFVRAMGLQLLDAPDGHLIAAAVADPEAMVRRVATESMGSLVRTPTLVAALRRALRDDDAAVREVACRVALFDEPLECSWDLLRALSDPSVVVRAAAFDALEWFPRISVLLALADARSSSDDPAPAESVLNVLARRIVTAFEGASAGARRRLDRWAGPVAWLLTPAIGRVVRQATEARTAAAGDPAGAEPDAGSDAPPAGRRTPPRVDLDIAARALPDADTPPSVQRELLMRRSWVRTGRRGREILLDCATSPNWALRQMAARPLAATGGVDALGALALDREAVVRRAAFVAVLDRPDDIDPRFLDAAWAALADPFARATAGDHALAVLAAGGGTAAVEEAVLRELSHADDRDGLFLGAIHLARLAGVTRAVPSLLAIVNSPVVASVGPHVAALQSLRSLGHPRTRIDLRQLDGVDHLDVQRELGEWGWHGARWG